MSTEYDQIRIVQAGADVFVFDVMNWPEGVFPHPIVYTACALKDGSFDANRIGWKYIKREQFEWLVKHFNCLVSYTGADQNERECFYCNNHKVWEHNGKDFSALETQEPEPEFYVEPDFNEERQI